MIFILDIKLFVFYCDCLKTSSRYVVIFLLRLSGQKNLLINAENAAGPMEVPQKSRIKTNCVKRLDCSSNGI